MGFCRLAELIGKLAPDRSRPIAPTPRRICLTATLSQLNSSHQVEFGREVPIEREFGWVQLPSDPQEEQYRVWVGFEIQTQEQVLKDATLVIATNPYSTDWFDWADFKPVRKRSAESLLRPFTHSRESTGSLLRSRKLVKYDPWETRSGGWLTARLSMPTRTDGLGVTAHGRSKTSPEWRAIQANLNRRWRRGDDYGVWCFGGCKDFERCRDSLRASNEAAELLARTDDGTLFDAFRTAGEAPYHDVADWAKALSQPVLDSAIIKTLAGLPPKGDRLFLGKQPRLAARLMTFIYTDTMYNLTKRLREPRAKVDPVLEASLGAVSTGQTVESDFEDQVEIWYSRFRKRAPYESFRLTIERMLADSDENSERDRAEACAAIAGAHQAGYGIHRSTTEILRRMAADSDEHPHVQQAARKALSAIDREEPSNITS